MESLVTRRDRLINEVFQNNLSDLKEEYEILQKENVNPDNICTQIAWDDKELEGKSKEDIEFIKRTRKFIQDLFNEYQIRATSTLAKKTIEYEKDGLTSDTDKHSEMMEDMQKESSLLIIEMFIKCINHCNKEERENAFNYYKQDLEQIENLYIDIKKKNKILENKNADLKQQIEDMKNKKFLGIFKVFK